MVYRNYSRDLGDRTLIWVNRSKIENFVTYTLHLLWIVYYSGSKKAIRGSMLDVRWSADWKSILKTRNHGGSSTHTHTAWTIKINCNLISWFFCYLHFRVWTFLKHIHGQKAGGGEGGEQTRRKANWEQLMCCMYSVSYVI